MRRSAGRGFTLIELMIGMALLAMLSIGMLTTVNLVGRTQRASAAIDVAQAAARAGLEMITRDVEMASAGARTGSIAFGNGAPAQLLAVRVTNSNTGPDQLDLLSVDTSAQATLMAPLAAGQTTLSVSSSAGFNVGDLIQVSDLTTAMVMQVSATTGGATPSLSVNANGNPQPQTFAAGSYVFRSRAVRYYVDTTIYGPQDPLLMFDPDGPGPAAGQPLAEGVEDFQVALGVDANGDGVLTNVGAAAGDDEWIFNVVGEAMPASLAQLRAVRVTVVARTVLPQAGTRGQRPGAEDHAGAAAADGYSRRVLRSEMTVRNFNL